MEIRMKTIIDNKLVNRKEINFEVAYETSPPTRLAVRDELTKQVKADPKFVIIKKMANVFGLRKMLCTADVYQDEATMKKTELSYALRRMTGEKKPEKVKAVAAPKSKGGK